MGLTIYWISVLSSVADTLVLGVLFGGAAAIVLLLIYLFEKDSLPVEEREASEILKKLWYFVKFFTVVCFTCLGVGIFIPSKTETYIITGVSQLEAQGTTKELAETAKLINQYLQGEIKKKIKEK